ncbi:PucR family transcriptional regulator [Rhizomonospora bruguierae]|uniref:PucR family transcriptional regulator n=1 Tax=Rhizomonospora bruguierae TaxID=1581705 RepID=UPI001BCB990D|nr:helix-turn-helix domain-containing protein [Micromonospora sp. NBRC 107566]
MREGPALVRPIKGIAAGHRNPAADAAAPHPLGSPRAAVDIPEVVQATAEALDTAGLAEYVFQRCRDLIFSAHVHDSDFLQSLRASINQNVTGLRDVITGRVTMDELQLDDVHRFAHVQAMLRIPQRLLQRSYRVAFYTQWEAWSDALRQHLVTTQLPLDAALSALHALTETVLHYQDHVASQVADIHTRESDALSQSRVHIRHSLVKTLLEDDSAQLSPADLAVLDYPLEHHHVAVLLPEVSEALATRIAGGIRQATGAHGTLAYPLSLSSSMLWISRVESWRPAIAARLDNVLHRLGVLAAISQPQRGPEGFRRCFEQAVQTDEVRAAWLHSDPHGAPAVVRYADVGLEALVLQDHEMAHNFVLAELGDLAADTSEAQKLRDTLEASFRLGSHVATAEHLGLHEHTIRNRLQRAEEILGRPLPERRTELQVALRMFRLLNAQPAGVTPLPGSRSGRP